LPDSGSLPFKDAIIALKNHISPDELSTKKPVNQVIDYGGQGVLIGKSLLINEANFKKIRQALPMRFRDKNWYCLFSTSVHGTSLATFHSRLENSGPTVMLIEDSNGYTFGGYASDEWVNHDNEFFGTGECFVFSVRPKSAFYKWTRANDYFMYSTPEGFAMGSGENGRFAFYLDAELQYGTSETSITFLNRRLASVEEFSCTVLEVWGFTYREPDFEEPKKLKKCLV